MRQTLFYLLAFCLFITPFLVSAAEGWLINSFNSNITLQPNGQVLIKETIAVDFMDLQKHGIYRDIPYVYQDEGGSKLYTQLDIKNVQRNNNSEPYKTTTNNANQRIVIGDPARTISGRHAYTITYEATGVVLPFTDYDEIYWNVTGHNWDVPIQKVSASISLPGGNFKQASCYAGQAGSRDTCQLHQVDNKTMRFLATKPLAAGEGLTIAIGFTKNLVPIILVPPPPTALDLLARPSTLITSIIVLAAGLFTVLRRWWKLGRDPRSPDTLSAEYDPPGGLRPAEIGVLVDERADTLDISATIVDLAVRGFLNIEELPKKWGVLSNADYQLKHTAISDTDLLLYEKKLLSALFKDGNQIKLSSLKKKFYKDLADIKKELYKDVTDKKLFTGHPEKVRKKNIGIAFLIIFIGIILTGSGFASTTGFAAGAGLALDIVGLTALIFAFFMPRRTTQGRKLYHQTLGYKLFVSGTEKYRQPFFERANVFMEVLPYAIIFGVTKKLAQAFAEMGLKPEPPTWYAGAQAFNAIAFASSMDSFSSSLSSALASSPRSSGSGGGGFSGGGFGGGGGGSW